MNFPAIHALVDSLEYAEEELNRHKEMEDHLTTQFIEGISQIEELKVIGRKATEERVGIVSLKPDFGSPEIHWVPFLKTQTIHVRGGLHCSSLHHQQLGLTNFGTLRFSFGWNSTIEHVSAALQSLKDFSCAKRNFI